MKYSAFACALCIAGAPVLSVASDNATRNSRYSYAQVTYVPYQEGELRSGDDTADGVSGRFSYHFVEQAYVFGRGTFTDYDDGIDYDAYSAGLGLRGSLGDTWQDQPDAGNVDIYAELSYENLQLEGSDQLADGPATARIKSDGFAGMVGLRWQATPWLELNPYGGYLDYIEPELKTSSAGVSFEGSANEDLDGARYGFRAVVDLGYRLSAIASFERSDLSIYGEDLDVNTARVGIRWYFPSRGLGLD